MALRELELVFDDEEPLRPEVSAWLERSQDRIQLFWDQFTQQPIEQYIECDFELVARALSACPTHEDLDGRLFVEWGCGFGVVCGLAALNGFDAIGIEAEAFLCQEARQLLAAAEIDAEIWQGNFLPPQARNLAEDSDPLVSLTHNCRSAYEQHGMSLDDFALIFAYPWPGEEHFLRAVFDRHARRGALMLMFRGPYQVELYRKS